jgi:hypothetical protein
MNPEYEYLLGRFMEKKEHKISCYCPFKKIISVTNIVMQGLLVEPNPFRFRMGLSKQRKAYHVNTCLSTLPRVSFLSFK